MQKRRQRFLLSAFGSVGVLVLLISILFGSAFLNAKKGAHAATATGGNLQKMQVSVNPMQPMKGMGVPMGNNGATTLSCLASTTLPLCYSP